MLTAYALQSIGSIQESSLQECIKAPQICALLVGKGVIVGKLLFVNFLGVHRNRISYVKAF